MPKKSLVIFLLTMLINCPLALGQNKDSLHTKLQRVFSSLDSLFNATDTTSAVDLIDHFLTAPKPRDTSKLLFRLGYNSNISSINQSLGIQQFGISPGVAYYHRSGLYADASTYWSKQFAPPIYLTILSAGYLKSVTPSYLFNAEYSYFLYPSGGQDIPPTYTHSISVSNQVDVKPIQLKLDYYYYFGTQSAHRLLPSVGFTVEKKNWGGIDRISIQPSFAVLFGTESTQQYAPLQLTSQQVLDRIKNGLPLYKTETVTVVGLMNYAFTLPVRARSHDWSFLLSYTYNIPRSLPDEELSLGNTGFLTVSIGRYLVFK